jgi:hypothetical protein
MGNPSYFAMREAEEAAMNERNARKLYRSNRAWEEVCKIAQEHDPETGFNKKVDPLKILDIFNRMKMDFLKIDGKV